MKTTIVNNVCEIVDMVNHIHSDDSFQWAVIHEDKSIIHVKIYPETVMFRYYTWDGDAYDCPGIFTRSGLLSVIAYTLDKHHPFTVSFICDDEMVKFNELLGVNQSIAWIISRLQ